MPFQRLLFFVNSWTVWKAIAWAAQTARSQPPAMDMWAPNLRRFAAIVRATRAAGFTGLSAPLAVEFSVNPSLADFTVSILQ